MKIETEQRCAVTLVKPDGPLNGPDAHDLSVMMSDLIKTKMVIIHVLAIVMTVMKLFIPVQKKFVMMA